MYVACLRPLSHPRPRHSPFLFCLFSLSESGEGVRGAVSTGWSIYRGVRKRKERRGQPRPSRVAAASSSTPMSTSKQPRLRRRQTTCTWAAAPRPKTFCMERSVQRCTGTKRASRGRASMRRAPMGRHTCTPNVKICVDLARGTGYLPVSACARRCMFGSI